MRFPHVSCLVIACAWLTGTMSVVAQHEQHEHPAGEPEKLGKVNFPVSCDAGLQLQFNRAVAMLHSFWYEKANEEFAAVAKKDPACGMAYWGIAMTLYHPIWEAPGAGALKQGSEAVAKAKLAAPKTQRERDYIAAIETFYKDSDRLDHHTRALAYEKAMEQLQARYPDDRGSASPTDKSYANQKKAGTILEKILVEQPDHPGVAHYIIHAYDYPSLTSRALDAARSYAKIAPDSPHALHMPSHIFTRLGLWQESIESNLASEAAAQKYNAPGNELHARDYLVYAYLQGGQDRAAKKVIDTAPPPLPKDPQYFNGLYATGTMSPRYAVERHRWAEAAALTVPPNTFPGGRYAWAEANIHLARALGASHVGDIDSGKKEVQQLASLRDTLVQSNEKYWADQVDIQREIATAWLTLVEGEHEEALRQMRHAADHEDSTDKHPVTPGMILPARELLGEMLLELKQPAQARLEFEGTLRTAPNRYNALSGAARAAKLSGNNEKAKSYYAKLLAICEHADEDRPELVDARALLAQK
jgi:tetratricopeptide (TPR) repeat protein